MANEIRRATHVITRPNKYASGMKRFPRPDAERKALPLRYPNRNRWFLGRKAGGILSQNRERRQGSRRPTGSRLGIWATVRARPGRTTEKQAPPRRSERR